MAFKPSGGTTAYQPAPSIQPKYGFRYSGSTFAPSMSPANIPTVQYTIPPYEAPTVAPTPYTPTTMGSDNNDNASSVASMQNSALNSVLGYNESINSEENNPTGGMTQANISNPVANPTDFFGNPVSKEVYSPELNPLDFVPGLGLAATLSGPSIPTSGYGTPGTVSGLSGGYFNQSSQAVNPYTGQPMAEFGTKGAFFDSLLDDPFSNTTSPQGNLSDIEYGAQTAPGINPNTGDSMVSIAYGSTNPNTGNPETTGYTPGSRGVAAQQTGIDMGFEAHTAAPGTPTNTAISTGQVTPGSQYSPTGVFTNIDDNNTSDDNSINDVGGDNDEGESPDADDDPGMSDWNTGGLVPPPNMGKRAQDIPNPILEDPLADYFRR